MSIMKNGIPDLDSLYWEDRYRRLDTGWDAGSITTPLRVYIDQLETLDLQILIPGAGYGHEAIYLHDLGFREVHVLDHVKTPLDAILTKRPDFPKQNLICVDFFDYIGEYDLIIEQTFFCAISPKRRREYAKKTAQLLKSKGKLVGLFFEFPLTKTGPPFGGDREEYRAYFKDLFDIKVLEQAYNSISPRAGRELFFIFEKNTDEHGRKENS